MMKRLVLILSVIFITAELTANLSRSTLGNPQQKQEKSALVRLVGEMPLQRPDRTLDPASGLATAYVNSNSDGDDGAPLTDYDLIGSSLDGTGVFALQAEHFNFLCIPPLSRDRDVGPSALLVASRHSSIIAAYCCAERNSATNA